MKKTLVILSALTLSACSTQGLLTSTEPQPTIYALRSGVAKPVSQNGAARVVEIGKPMLPPGFETDRIALYSDGGQKLDYFSGAHWADTLDVVIQDFTRRTLNESLPYVVPVTQAQGLNADYRLQVKLNEFQPVYINGTDATPTLRVSAEFTLISLPGERIVRSFTLSKHTEAQSNELDAITGGLEELMRSLNQDAFARIDPVLKRPAGAE